MPKHTPAREKFEKELATLVARFDQHRADYLRSDYSEAEVRLQFINPLFEALGWDVQNQASKSRAECDVVVERGETIGNPDYAFRLNGQTLFYVEAKAPHVSLEKSSAALQAKKYAWNTPEPFVYFAAATDFEEFRFYDASLKPDPKHPHVGLIFSYRYNEYLTKQALDDMWQLSYEAVGAGSLEKLLKPSARAARQRSPLDQIFLSDLTAWREKLAKSIFKIHPELIDTADLNNVVQIFLDRLIFIRVAEDRGVLETGRLKQIARTWKEGDHDRSIMAELLLYFRDVNDRLNGEIFRRHRCEELRWESALAAEIVLEGLEPYDFNKIGVELLGSIYERYLGKTIRVTATRAVVEDKPEVRKAGGVYYTPKYIVDYIVNQTVGKLIEGKTPAQIAKLKILDPACGSGSFLIGAYQKLLDYHAAYYTQRASRRGGGGLSTHQARLLQEPSAEYGDYKLSLAEKAEILRNNIFGVDIDPQAVEITMMSLYIKMLEGERGAMMGQGILPRLNANIKCGNSLIAHDIGVLTEEDGARINPFDWNSKGEGFGDIMAAGGFDAVIGNPPYGASFGDSEAKYFVKHYSVFGDVKDVYMCFIEMSIARLAKNGRFSFIVPSAWLGGPGYGKLRELLLHQQIENIVLLPFNVFADAYVDTTVFVASKRIPSNDHQVQTFVYDKRTRLETIGLNANEYRAVEQSAWSTSDDKKFVLDPGAIDLIVKIRQSMQSTFDDVTQIKRGVLFDKDLLTDRRTSKTSYRYFEGDVYRYEINLLANRWIEYDDRLKERPKEFVWFEGERILLRRLVNRRQRLMAALAVETFVTNKNLYSVLSKREDISIKAVLGALNSRLISYLYINQVTQATKDDFPQVTIKDVLALPFPNFTDKSRHDKMVTLVERILELHKQKQASKSDTARERIQREINITDEQIDALVYELYGLTKDEIKIVEESAR
ncbi:MAG: N-6 DNA methylase [Chloroflexi bacterium]|nr:N-6 DNA methylase [Chloroflexota bacterium]